MEGYWCFRKWVQWSPCIGGAKCILIASNDKDVQSFLSLQRLLARSVPRRRSRRACVRSYVQFCMCVCIYVYVCMCVDMYICIYMHVCMYLYIYAFIHMFMCITVYAYSSLCIDCGSWYQCFSVWTVSCMRMCFRVHMYAYTYVCGYIYICAFFCSECYMHFTGVLGTSAWAGVYVTQVCFYTNVHICEHTRCRLCTYVYMYIRVCMHAYAYGCVCVSMI